MHDECYIIHRSATVRVCVCVVVCVCAAVINTDFLYL